MMDIRQILAVTLFGMTLITTGCAEHMSMMKNSRVSLHERLGGRPAITAVVDEFVGRVAKDSRINSRFANANIPKLKIRLVEQICQVSGGPCTYMGQDMKTAHAGMGISNAEFGALVEALIAAINKFNVPKQEKNELLGALAALQSDIVERS